MAHPINMPESMKDRTPEYRDGYIAYHSGKMRSENAQLDMGGHAEWDKGWQHAFNGGPATAEELAEFNQLPVITPFEQHLKQHNLYETRAFEIMVMLEKHPNFFDDNCTQSCSFERFTCDPKDGHIRLEASTTWTGDNFYRTANVPLAWFEAVTVSIDTVTAWADAVVERRMAEEGALKLASQAAADAKKRAEALATLAKLQQEYPNDFLMLINEAQNKQ